MRKFLFAAATAASLLSISPMVASAETSPSGEIIFGVDHPGDRPVADQVQFFWGGRNYCWYDGGWRGPGFYWCGYAWRRGIGWGGGYGWRGWRGGHPLAYYRGRPEYRGWRGWGHPGGPRGEFREHERR